MEENLAKAVSTTISALRSEKCIEDATLHESRVPGERRASLHVRMRKVSPEGADGNESIRRADQFFVIVLWQNLATLEDRFERNHACALFHRSEIVAVRRKEAAVSVPACEEMVADEEEHG